MLLQENQAVTFQIPQLLPVAQKSLFALFVFVRCRSVISHTENFKEEQKGPSIFRTPSSSHKLIKITLYTNTQNHLHRKQSAIKFCLYFSLLKCFSFHSLVFISSYVAFGILRYMMLLLLF